MHGPSTSIETTVSPGSRSSGGTRLHGRWLLLARTLWVVVVSLSLGLFVTAIVLHSAELGSLDKALRGTLLHPNPFLSGYITSKIPLALLFGSSLGLMSVFMSISSWKRRPMRRHL
jgi:hypothetical protein